MQKASFDVLADKVIGGGSFAERMHPNPRYYKYYWWVFHMNSPCDGDAFHTDEYRMSFYQAKQLMDELDANDQAYWIYNERLPRMDPQNPWDPNSPHWEGKEWAVSYDGDPDPERDGFK